MPRPRTRDQHSDDTVFGMAFRWLPGHWKTGKTWLSASQSQKPWRLALLWGHPVNTQASQCFSPLFVGQERTDQLTHSMILGKGKNLTTKLVKYLLQVLLQLFDSSHVVSIFNTQWNRLCLSTQSFKLKWPRVSVHVFHQEAGRILSQQSGKQNLSTRHKSSRTYRFRKGESQRLEKELVIN